MQLMQEDFTLLCTTSLLFSSGVKKMNGSVSAGSLAESILKAKRLPQDISMKKMLIASS